MSTVACTSTIACMSTVPTAEGEVNNNITGNALLFAGFGQ